MDASCHALLHRYTHSAQSVELLKDGQRLGNAIPLNNALTDITPMSTLLAGLPAGSTNAYANMRMAGLYVVDRALSDAQMQAAAASIGYPAAHLSTAALSAAGTGLSNGGSVSVWSGFAQAVSGQQPLYYSSGGYASGAYVAFTRTSSQHLDGGSRVLNIGSNGGLTIVALVLFTGTAGSQERIIDFGSGTDSSNVILSRQGTTSNLNFQIYEGNVTGSWAVAMQATSCIVQDEWALFAVSCLLACARSLSLHLLPAVGQSVEHTWHRTVHAASLQAAC